jgi:hypothetical protein
VKMLDIFEMLVKGKFYFFFFDICDGQNVYLN